jgi:hypothetical protein
VRIHLAAEHAPELELAHGRLEALALLLELERGRFVVFALGHAQQLERVARAVARAVELAELGLQPDAFLAKLLCTLWVGPDLRFFEFTADFFEAITLVIVFKETPSRRRRAPRCLAMNA